MYGLIDKPKEWTIIGPVGKVIASFDNEQIAQWYADALRRLRGISCRVERTQP